MKLENVITDNIFESIHKMLHVWYTIIQEKKTDIIVFKYLEKFQKNNWFYSGSAEHVLYSGAWIKD